MVDWSKHDHVTHVRFLLSAFEKGITVDHRNQSIDCMTVYLQGQRLSSGETRYSRRPRPYNRRAAAGNAMATSMVLRSAIALARKIGWCESLRDGPHRNLSA